MNQDDSKLRISVLYYNKDSQVFETHNYYVANGYTDGQDEFKHAVSTFSGFNLRTRNEMKRSLCVFVNPFGGRKNAKMYYENILKPVLEFNSISHEMYETDSPTFIEKFVSNFKAGEVPFTEFVVIGGDGLFGQLFNAIMAHPDHELLRKMPIGIIPGGTGNSLACDMGCKDPCIAAIHVARGKTIDADMFKLDTQDTKKTFYSTAMTYGYPCEVAIEAEGMRDQFGRYRYVACGAKKIFSSGSILHDAEIYYKDSEDQAFPACEKPNFCKPSIHQTSSVQSPKIMSYKTIGSVNNEWKKLPFGDKFLCTVVVTHEIRSSFNSEIFAPFAKLGEGNMYIAGVKDVSRLQVLKYAKKASENKQMDYDKYFYQKASELKFKTPVGSNFAVDGEPHKSHEFNIKLLPGFVSLLGRKDHVNMN